MKKKRKAFVPSNICVACGRCEKECPLHAISIYKGMYAVVGSACVGCGKCANVCPAGIISIEETEGGV